MTAKAFTRFDKYCTEINSRELITWLQKTLPSVCMTLKLTSRQATKLESELTKLEGALTDDHELASELTKLLSSYNAELWDKVKSKFRKYQFDQKNKRLCISLSTHERLLDLMNAEKMGSIQEAIDYLLISYYLEN